MTFSNLTLELLKQHCNIDEEYKEDDNLLLTYLQISCGAVEKHLRIESLEDLVNEEGELPTTVQGAIMLYTAHLYANREPVAFASAQALPYTYSYLLDLEMSYAD